MGEIGEDGAIELLLACVSQTGHLLMTIWGCDCDWSFHMHLSRGCRNAAMQEQVDNSRQNTRLSG
jgi:hypothetical protein